MAVVPTTKDLFVKAPVVKVQEEPDVKFSWAVQPSTVNLYSIGPGAIGRVTAQMLVAPSLTIGLHAPHQLLKVPFI